MRAKTIVSSFLFFLFLLNGTQAMATCLLDDGTGWLRDPFRYATSVDAKAKEVAAETKTSAKQNKKTKPDIDHSGLTAIYGHKGIYQALYDGQLVNAGDKIESLQIHKILPDSIIIEDGDGRRSIELFHEQIRQSEQ